MDNSPSLRLVLITETFPPEVNGVARTLGRWVEEFRRRGHDVRILRPRQAGEPATPDLVHGVPVPTYPQLRFGMASPQRLRQLMRQMTPNVVHIATEGPLGWAALTAATALGLPIASSFHTNFDHYFTHYGIPGLEWTVTHYLCWFHNRTAVTLVPSEATKRRLETLGVRHVAIWSRGVDANAFHPRHRDETFRRSLGLQPDDVLLLYVGRLAPEKNLGELVAAFGRLRERVSQPERLRLAIVGDGPSLAALQALQSDYLLLPGVQLGADLSRWYASGDLFAFPSCSETFGNVVLEAQASGLPVVGFDAPGVSERVSDGVDGLLVPMGGDLTGSLRRLVEDGDLRQRYGAAGRAKAVQQSWDAIFDELENRYRALAAAPGVPRLKLASGGA